MSSVSYSSEDSEVFDYDQYLLDIVNDQQQYTISTVTNKKEQIGIEVMDDSSSNSLLSLVSENDNGNKKVLKAAEKVEKEVKVTVVAAKRSKPDGIRIIDDDAMTFD